MSGKRESIADEIGVVLERKGSGFRDAGCSKVSSLGLEALRVQWLGTRPTRHLLPTPQSGERDTQGAPLGPKGSLPALETSVPPTIPPSAHGSPILEFHRCPPKDTFVFSLSSAKDTSPHSPQPILDFPRN